ncbi:MAG: hypothetical protein JSS79_14365 [Bacteroidetes bacterium]|nr:hypothetical protein [Bacteroidota bacterium]
MIPLKIRQAIQNHPELTKALAQADLSTDWKKFNRTVFDFIARHISKVVTQRALESPQLVHEKIIIGKDQLQRLSEEKKLKSEDDFLQWLSATKRTFHWISGKTLQSYWQNGQPKETKLNVLLVFLGIPQKSWDDWKMVKASSSFLLSPPQKTSSRKGNQELIRKYFLGSYFLYYSKSDLSPTLIKAPFTLAEDEQGNLVAETITEGHLYRSSLIELREGILYIHCENLVFNEKENHIFNVGNETNPEVLFGISNTISVKSKLAIGIRNVLIRQKKPFTTETFAEKEINFAEKNNLSDEEATALAYFRMQKTNVISAHHCCSLEVLKKEIIRK